MDTLTEARRIATNTTRQRVDAATRRAALAQLRPLDVVQVVDQEADRVLPPGLLWQVEETAGGARAYLLSDWRRGPEGLVCLERRFNADGVELDAQGRARSHGRILVAPVLPASETRALMEGLLGRWDRALREREAEWRASLPPRQRQLLECEWPKETGMDLSSFQETALDEPTRQSIRDVIGAIAVQRVQEVRDSGLPGEQVEAAIQASIRVDTALTEVPRTDGEVALLLAHLPAEVVTRALALAEQLRERFPPPKQG